MSRRCARPSCGRPAEATLCYAYAERIVWLYPLAEDDHPMVHDMCRLHADAIRVPQGWELRDLRQGQSRLTLAAG